MTAVSRNKRKVCWSVLAAASAAVAALNHSAPAATKTWDGGGVDDNVNTAANWVGDVAPVLNAANSATADDWIFTGTNRLTPNINVNPAQLLFTLTFDANAGAFTITNSAASTMQIGNTGGGGGNIVNNSPNVQTFSTGIAPRAGAITANTADIVLNGLFNVGNDSVVDRRTNTFNGSANLILNGQMTGFGKITKNGSGTLFLTNDSNDFQGTLTISTGAVRISAAHALGQFSTAGGTSGATIIAGNVDGTGRLELSGGITLVAEPMRLDARQGASATVPHILNISGNNTLTGPISYNTGGSEYTFQSAAGKLTVAGNITNTAGVTSGLRNIHFNGAGDGEVSGAILYGAGGATVNVLKEGAGTWTLSGSNTYNGTVTVSGGTLVLSNNNSTAGQVLVNAGTFKLLSTGSINNTRSITLAPGANFDVTDFAAGGGHNLSASTTLNGGGHVKGLLNVGGGAQVSGGAISTPDTITFENGLNFNGAGIVNSFFSGTSHSLIDVTGGDLSATGSNDIKVTGFGFGVGQYPLLRYTGALGGDGFSAFNLAQVPARATGTLVNNTAAHSIDLNVTAIDFPKWTGAVNGNWDIDTTANWKEINSGNPTTYLQPGIPGDAVLFDQTGTATSTVILTTTLAPANITVDNASYTFSGTGAITGLARITKTGSGTLIFANSGTNDYTGGTLISGGTLQIGDAATGLGGSLSTGPVTNNATLIINRNDAFSFTNTLSGAGSLIKSGTGTTILFSANGDFTGTTTIAQGTLRATGSSSLGSTNAAVFIQSGGALDVNANQMGHRAVSVVGSGVGGAGAILNTGGGQNNALENVTLTGDATFGGTGRWDIRNLGALTQLSTAGHAYNLTKVGSNQISLVDVTVDPALADVNLNAGTFSIETNTTGLGNPNNTLTLTGSATLQLFNLIVPLDKKIVTTGAATILGNTGANNTLLGPLSIGGNATVQVNSATILNIPNVVSGTGGVLKAQTGTLNLTNVNAYTGPTSIVGTLNVTSLANGGLPSGIGRSDSSAANLTFNGGTLRFTGAAAAATDRLMTISGGTTIDASGSAGATLSFTNTNAAVLTPNPTTNITYFTLTLTGSNAGDNIFSPSIGDMTPIGNGVLAVGQLTKSGFGTWVLPNANTFTGNVTVSGGVLKVRNSAALGGPSNLVTISDNTANPNPASVVFDNPAGVTIPNNFKTTGGGGGGQNPDGPGVIHSAAGSNTLTGTLTLTSGGGFSTCAVDAGSTLTIAGTITNDQNRTVFLSGAGQGIVSGLINNGTGTQSVEKRGAGTWTLSNIGNGYTGSTVVTDGALRVTGSIATSSGVTVNGGTFDVAATQTVNALSVNGGGTAVVSAGTLKVGVDSAINPLSIGELGSNIARVDLKTNAVIVDYSAGNEQATLQYVRGKIISAYNAGAWDGQGITSSNAAADQSKAIGYAQASEIFPPGGGVFLNQSVDDTAILTRYTLAGDTNLDGTVNFADLVALAQHYGADLTDPNGPNLTDSWWTHGDFNYDGMVNFTDLVKLAQNYNATLPTEPLPGAPIGFQDDLARPLSSVPEPTSLSFLGMAACGLAGRRRRRPQTL